MSPAHTLKSCAARSWPSCSACAQRAHPYFNMAKLEDGLAKRVIDHHFTARQQTPPVYDLNASIYVFKRAFCWKMRQAFVGRQVRHLPDVRHRHHRH